MCCPEICKMKYKIKRLENLLQEPMSTRMFLIKLQDYKIIVICERCFEKGYVDINCKQCGGKGTHNKTKQKWEVCKKTFYINRIDRDEDGIIRYWEDMSCFFRESDKLLHFTYRDAVNECKRRNELIT